MRIAEAKVGHRRASGLAEAAADTLKEGVKAATTSHQPPPPLPSLVGRTAIVTGANSGSQTHL